MTGFWIIPRDSPRGDVARYIRRANATGTAFAKQYRGVSSAYRSFIVVPHGQSVQVARLRLSARRLTQLRIALQEIPAPPRARLLRLRLIAFYRRQEQVAHELVGIAAYFPRLIAAERPLGRAGARMRTMLASARTPEKQARALGLYANVLGSSIGRIESIPAPALLAKARQAESRRLAKTMRSVQAVQHALLSHNRGKLKEAVAGLRTTSNAASLASRAAIVAYNRHVAEIRHLGVEVERERRRLDRSLG